MSLQLQAHSAALLPLLPPSQQRPHAPCSTPCRLVDKELAAKLESEEVDFIQFAWRWINCLLLREVPFHLSLRLVREARE